MSSEHVVANVNDLRDGQMKEAEVEQHSILLLRVNGEYHAIGGTCPHHGAPLVEGVLREGHVRCPWHQAVFDVASGLCDQPPSLDDLPRFDVRVDGEDVLVRLPDEIPESCAPRMVRADPAADGRTFVILGCGAAGAAAAQTLRQEGFQGRVVMITREEHLPYDRTELSKRFLRSAKARPPMLRDGEFFSSHGIEVLTGREVAEVSVTGKTVTFADGSSLQYDRILLATGAEPRTLGVPGEDLENVLVLRSMDDCERIRGRLDSASRAVVVGASFIGMEASACLAKRGLSVTVVAPSSASFERAFGPDIGRMYQTIHEEKGVVFRMGATVERFEGDGRLNAVVLEGGERLEADVAILGVGVQPGTQYVSGLEVGEDGSISVDSHMRAAEDVYVAGDIARWPDWRTGAPVRIEHWRLAQQHGQVAAKNMLGRDTRYAGVPFFWTEQFMVATQYVGHARTWDEIVFDGDPARQQFVAYYVKDGRVFAAAGCQEDHKMGLIAERLCAASMPTVDELREEVSGAAQSDGT